MATRLYIDPTAIPYTPATIRGAWDATGTPSTGKLTLVPTGSNTAITKTETVATNNYDILFGRWVSDGLVSNKTIAGTIALMMRVSEANLAANAFFHVHIYVTTGNSDTPRGTLLSDYIGATEFTTTNGGLGFTGVSLTSVAAQAGDRIVIEIGAQLQNTVTTSYNIVMSYGGAGTTDLVSGNTTAANPKWIQFSDDIPFVAKIATLVDDFNDNSIGAGYTNWGGANVLEQNQQIEVTGSTVNGNYYGMDVNALYDMSGSSAFIQLVNAGAQSAFRICQPIVIQTPNGDNSAFWNLQNNILTCTMNTLGSYTQIGSNLAYNSAVHKFFRIREASGTFYWDYATIGDGSDWTNYASTTTYWPMSAVLVSICTIGNEGGTAPANSFAYFDNLNVAGGSTTTTTTTTGSTGKIKVYNGSAFVAKPMKYYNGSAFVAKPVKRWNGSAWVPTNY